MINQGGDSADLGNALCHRLRLIEQFRPDLDAGERIALAIDGADTHNSGQDGRVIVASLSGERRELNDAALLAAFAAFPLLTLKVVAGIHWEALKLWIKGMRLRPRPPAPQAITIVSRPLLRSSEVHGGHHV